MLNPLEAQRVLHGVVDQQLRHNYRPHMPQPLLPTHVEPLHAELLCEYDHLLCARHRADVLLFLSLLSVLFVRVLVGFLIEQREEGVSGLRGEGGRKGGGEGPC